MYLRDEQTHLKTDCTVAYAPTLYTSKEFEGRKYSVQCVGHNDLPQHDVDVVPESINRGLTAWLAGSVNAVKDFLVDHSESISSLIDLSFSTALTGAKVFSFHKVTCRELHRALGFPYKPCKRRDSDLYKSRSKEYFSNDENT